MREIIYAWNYREWGGAQIYFLSLMKEAKKRYAVTALIPADSEPKILQYLDSIEVPFEFVSTDPCEGLPDNKIRRKRAILTSERKLVDEILARPKLHDTIVHVDLGFWQSFLALYRLCRKMNVFMTVHTGLPAYSGWRAGRGKVKGKIISCLSTFHLLASNKEAKGSLRAYIGATKFGQIEVTYSGIDPDEINTVTEYLPPKSIVRRRYGIPENAPILVTVGQFVERKGCWILLESLRQLKNAGKDFVFLWLSMAPPDEETRKRIEAFDLGDSFRLMDAEEIGESRSDLLTLLGSADIFVLPSLKEGLPIALIEAMALGLPCISTAVNAIPEAIDNERNGILIKPNDPTALREAIARLLNDGTLRERLGAAAKRAAFEEFNSKISARRTVELHDEGWQQ